MRTVCIISHPIPLWLVFALALSGCADNRPITYAGQVLPQAGTCDPAARGVLIKQGHFVRFTPHDGVLILTGDITPDGVIAARATAPGADHKPYPLTFTGRLDGDSITGAFTSARCRATVSLKRAS